MSLKFSLTSGEDLVLNDGLPPNYNGIRLTGAETRYVEHPGVSIIVQQYRVRNIGISLKTFTWRKPERIICESSHSPVLFVRTLLNHYLSEVIKAVGDIYLEAKHFYALAGTTWYSFLEPSRAGVYYLLDLTWKLEDTIESILTTPPAYQNGLPQKLMELPCCNSPALQRCFEDLLRLKYSSTHPNSFRELMDNCLSLVQTEVDKKNCIKSTMSDADWHYVEQAKKVINENLEKRLSTPEISVMIGLNEYKLKKVFKKATGYAIDEYRKYQLFTGAARTFMQSHGMPVKTMSANTGYESEASMLRAFKNAMFCTPGEIKTGQWDLSRLNIIPQEKWK